MTKRPGFGWDRTPHELAVEHLGYSADQVRDLLPFVTGKRQVSPEAVGAACIDSFVLNVRLIIDFLIKGRERYDVLAAEVVPGWEAGADQRGKLDSWHDLASKHAMHMSRRRFDEDPEGPLTAEDFRQMARDTLGAYESFVASYRESPAS